MAFAPQHEISSVPAVFDPEAWSRDHRSDPRAVFRIEPVWGFYMETDVRYVINVIIPSNKAKRPT
ncbi:hypothetical protein B9G55_23465 [Saccharibacillus sp. O16]|nr:hypothetical protein B9G55_23465 [Saccharibacillus sp. O16]